ncbi:hypothetical protein FIBSPDRAFT_972572 [Athelia psychrophila]|uniref:Peptidase A1 domain-containing protein n=1 Tax=Athelia psychrophila TaxID=1759441 RepID=A0A166GDY7_9AGAM|nr:hypothetical protein FIBSPDRAFT_972572 [Fibularhizoctonia sp. CBS 109695]
MQFFKSTLFVAIAVAASFVAAAPAETECLPLIAACTLNSDCCKNKCIASRPRSPRMSDSESSQGSHIFPCSATLPSLTLGVGAYHAVVPGTYLNYASATDISCFGGLQLNTGIGMSIYGDVFLKDNSNTAAPRLGLLRSPFKVERGSLVIKN